MSWSIHFFRYWIRAGDGCQPSPLWTGKPHSEADTASHPSSDGSVTSGIRQTQGVRVQSSLPPLPQQGLDLFQGFHVICWPRKQKDRCDSHTCPKMGSRLALDSCCAVTPLRVSLKAKVLTVAELQTEYQLPKLEGKEQSTKAASYTYSWAEENYLAYCQGTRESKHEKIGSKRPWGRSLCVAYGNKPKRENLWVLIYTKAHAAEVPGNPK